MTELTKLKPLKSQTELSYRQQEHKQTINTKQISAAIIKSAKTTELGNEENLSFGYSSLKSRDIRSVHSLSLRILATISLPCHLPHHSYSAVSNSINQ